MRWAIVAVAVLLVAALLWLRYGQQERTAREQPLTTPAPPPAPPPEPVVPPEPPGLVLRGVVRLPDGDRASYAVVHVNCGSSGDVARAFAFADREGAFELPLPRREGRMDLVVEHPGSDTTNVLRMPAFGAEPVWIRLTSVTLSGRAVDREGRPVGYASVEILARTPPSFWSMEGFHELVCRPLLQADREGRFSVRIQQRPVLVVCRAPLLLSSMIDAGARSADLGDIVLEPLLPPVRELPATEALR